MAEIDGRTRRVRKLLLAVVSSALLLSCLLLAIVGRNAVIGDDLSTELQLSKVLVVVAVLQACLFYSGIHDDRLVTRRIELFVRMAEATIATMLVLAVTYFLFPDLRVRPISLMIFMLMVLVFIPLWNRLRLWASSQDTLRESVLILGSGLTAARVADELGRSSRADYRLLGMLAERPAELGPRGEKNPLIGTIADLEHVTSTMSVQLIVVALEDRRGKLPVRQLLDCRLRGIAVVEATTFLEGLTGQIQVWNLRPSWLVFSSGFYKSHRSRVTKEVVERIVALIFLILASPVLLLAGLLIKLESSGPIFYRQERVGEGQTTFGVLKLRTMRTDAEAQGPVWASGGADKRVTRVGRLLRKLRLDELPQFINVLRGEMSLVGPRPERPHFVKMLSQVISYYDQRHTVKPGITGWAQVKFRYGSTLEDAEEKLQYDIYYIKHMSLFLDIAILLETVRVVLYGRGSR